MIGAARRARILSFGPHASSALSLRGVRAAHFINCLLRVPGPRQVRITATRSVRRGKSAADHVTGGGGTITTVGNKKFCSPGNAKANHLPCKFVVRRKGCLLKRRMSSGRQISFINVAHSKGLVTKGCGGGRLRSLNIARKLAFNPPLVVGNGGIVHDNSNN